MSSRNAIAWVINFVPKIKKTEYVSLLKQLTNVAFVIQFTLPNVFNRYKCKGVNTC